VLRRVEGAQAAGTGDGGQTTVPKRRRFFGSGSTGTESGDHPLFFNAGWRMILLPFDPLGALNNFQFTADFFTDKDVCSIVWKCPTQPLGQGDWPLGSDAGLRRQVAWVQADRGWGVCLPRAIHFPSGRGKKSYLPQTGRTSPFYRWLCALRWKHAGDIPWEESNGE